MASTQTGNQKVKLTKSVIEKTSAPATGQCFLRDSELLGFALRVTPGAKSFVVEKRIKGKVKRMTLARYPELTVEQARKHAQKLLGEIAGGSDPTAKKKRDKLQSTTLAQAFRDFLIARKNLRPYTVYNYARVMEVAFVDWQERPIVAITKDMVAKRHSEMGETRGQAYANLAMRFLRALLNFAIARYEEADGTPILRDNPVKRLSQTRAWYRIERRQTIIRPHHSLRGTGPSPLSKAKIVLNNRRPLPTILCSRYLPVCGAKKRRNCDGTKSTSNIAA